MGREGDGPEAEGWAVRAELPRGAQWLWWTLALGQRLHVQEGQEGRREAHSEARHARGT